MPHNPFGIATIAFLALFFPAVGILAGIRNRRAPIAHVHEINADRSNVMLTDSGAIFCRCCVAGCDEGVFIGGDVAALWRSQQTKPLDYNPNDDLDDPASMEGSYRPEFANQQERCGKTNRNAGYASCVKPVGHLGNHEDSCGCWWR